MASEPDTSMSASVDEVLITAELARRAAHAPDFAAENRALAALATEMASQPHRVLHKLAELVVELCDADSAGISILESDGAVESFRWHATAGAFAGSLGTILPRHASPCGIVIELGPEQLLGHGWHAVLHPDDLQPYLETVGGALRRQARYQRRVRIRVKDSGWHPFDAHGAPWFGADGRFRGHVGICIDISATVQTEDALRDADRRKDEFLATLAHELRNPLRQSAMRCICCAIPRAGARAPASSR